MNAMKRGAAAVVLVLGVLGPGRASAETRAMPIEECVSIAIARNPESLSADYEVEAAESGRTGVRGEMLPKLRAEANVQEWDRPFELPFGPTVFRVRDPFTWTATVSVVQPLSGLLNTLERYKVERVGVDVARLRRDATRRDLGFRVAETYLRLLEAMRLDEIAKASVTQLEAQRKQAQSLYANGVIGKNDALRAELALANAKQREIQARGQVVLVRGRLAVAMGLSPDSAIEPVPLPPEPAAAGTGVAAGDDTTLEAAQSRAVAQRLEVRELAQRIDQQDARVSAARSRLLPQVSAVGSYVHTEGSAFAQKDAAYVGALASWDVWDWGTTTSAIGEAAARREQAKLAKTKLEDDVRLEARQAFVDLDTAREALAVAKTALEQAEENYRIVTKRFEQAAGTSFDVVDAESLLTTARAQVENAQTGLLVARLSLQRATGAMIPRVR